MMRLGAWLICAIAAGIPAASAQDRARERERVPSWLAACPPFCDPPGFFGREADPGSRPSPRVDPPVSDDDDPVDPVPPAVGEASSPSEDATEGTLESRERETSSQANAESPVPPTVATAPKLAPVEPVLERPTPALKERRAAGANEEGYLRPTSDMPAPGTLERPTEALKVPLPPRKPAADTLPKPRSAEKREFAAAPVAAPVAKAKKKAVPVEKLGPDSLIKPVEPIFDPRYPADAMVRTDFGIPDLTKDGFRIMAFDGRNRVFLQKGAAVALCRFDSVEIPVAGGSYVGRYECYVTQRPVRP